MENIEILNTYNNGYCLTNSNPELADELGGNCISAALEAWVLDRNLHVVGITITGLYLHLAGFSPRERSLTQTLTIDGTPKITSSALNAYSPGSMNGVATHLDQPSIRAQSGLSRLAENPSRFVDFVEPVGTYQGMNRFVKVKRHKPHAVLEATGCSLSADELKDKIMDTVSNRVSSMV